MNNKLINYKKKHCYEFYTFTKKIKKKKLEFVILGRIRIRNRIRIQNRIRIRYPGSGSETLAFRKPLLNLKRKRGGKREEGAVIEKHGRIYFLDASS